MISYVSNQGCSLDGVKRTDFQSSTGLEESPK